MSSVPHTVRVMRKEEVPGALEIWKETGMQEGINSPYTWMEVDPEAFHVAVTDSGEVIAVCSAVLHTEDVAFVGMYACKKEYRGMGLGHKVWKAAMDHIGPNRNAVLNAVPDKLELYRDRGGFPIVETGWTCVVNEIFDRGVDHTTLSDVPPDGVNILPYEEALHLPLMLEYDLALVGYPRELGLRLTFREGQSRTVVAIKEGRCVGFGCIKMSIHKCAQIGPLYADDPAVAEVMLRRLIVALPEAVGFAMMTVDVNKEANEFMRRVGCPTTEECPRMYRREKMDVDLSKVFGQLNLNFCIY